MLDPSGESFLGVVLGTVLINVIVYHLLDEASCRSNSACMRERFDRKTIEDVNELIKPNAPNLNSTPRPRRGRDTPPGAAVYPRTC